jgi:hypothetical protein
VRGAGCDGHYHRQSQPGLRGHGVRSPRCGEHAHAGPQRRHGGSGAAVAEAAHGRAPGGADALRRAAREFAGAVRRATGPGQLPPAHRCHRRVDWRASGTGGDHLASAGGLSRRGADRAACGPSVCARAGRLAAAPQRAACASGTGEGRDRGARCVGGRVCGPSGLRRGRAAALYATPARDAVPSLGRCALCFAGRTASLRFAWACC